MAAEHRSHLTVDQMRQLAAGDVSAAAFLPALISTLAEGDEEHRAWASDALATLEQIPAKFADELGDLTRSDKPVVASWACKLLVLTGPAGVERQGAICRVLQEYPEVTVRQQAAMSLGRLPELYAESRAALQWATTQDDPRLVRLAQAALQRHAQ